MAKYYSTKRYGNDRGLSCCFRQWKSTHSHCSLLHGYSIGIKLVFVSETLDDKNWVMDFGGLKAFKEWSEYMFDHTLVIAEDDPNIEFFKQMDKLDGGYNNMGICDLRIVKDVGCERFSEIAYNTMQDILHTYKQGQAWQLKDVNGNVLNEFVPRYPVGNTVKLQSVEVFEHDANSAMYEG
jgi:6-pyruvoyltetrahydropterin/6-carboxytetrahydropterin synthase